MTKLIDQLTEFQSHKIVRAAPIKRVRLDDSAIDVDLGDGLVAEVACEPGMFARYVPVAGDFYVIYRDGYPSISPRQEFVDGYTECGCPAALIEPPPPAAPSVPVLMSKANPSGWKLEELLVQLAHEIETLKTPLIAADPRPVAQMVVEHNNQIVVLLRKAAEIQAASYASLASIGPNQGPLGKPRIGVGS